MRTESLEHRQVWVFALAIGCIGILMGISVALSEGIIIALIGISVTALAVLILKQVWMYTLWIAIFGLVIWSYGFNNVPLVAPIPLVDGLVLLSLVLGLRFWWKHRKCLLIRRLFFINFLLCSTVVLRLVVDFPRFGLAAARDALFAFELLTIFPAIAAGFQLGEVRLARRLLWLFSMAMIWFLLYPWRDIVAGVSPVFGIRRPVPLFAFTTAGFVSVPAFFWFMCNGSWRSGLFGAGAALVVLLLVQSRGAYVAFLVSTLAMLLMHPLAFGRWIKLAMTCIPAGAALLMLESVPGRLGEPVSISTVLKQLLTLAGEEGPGAGSFQHRLVAWPSVIEEVLNEPLGPLFGVGLGPDLFQGFSLGPEVLVRKPHNDFLEIWARLGIPGVLSWMGILVVLGHEAFRAAKKSPKHIWILALQIILWITSASQPAMGFAYITVVWTGLTGLWIGARLRSSMAIPAQPGEARDANLAPPHPLPPTRW